ncbi:uncharacterized protein METZ01_LOCUS245173 [marine metagenome]|uniref:Uncharacterized protein n=1 Tax=marine metagenome TaxID=408172 RepID=A0A382HZ14_9ZZZZ
MMRMLLTEALACTGNFRGYLTNPLANRRLARIQET